MKKLTKNVSKSEAEIWPFRACRLYPCQIPLLQGI